MNDQLGYTDSKEDPGDNWLLLKNKEVAEKAPKILNAVPEISL
jgi:hypothetical protein